MATNYSNNIFNSANLATEVSLTDISDKVPSTKWVKDLLSSTDNNQSSDISFLTILSGWCLSNSYAIVSTTIENNLPKFRNIIWPDGATGTWSIGVADSTFPDEINSWNATYNNGSIFYTISQPIIVRDPNSGIIITKPSIVIS